MSFVARCPQCGSIDLSYVGLACRTYKNDWHQHFTERGHEGGEVRDSYFYGTWKEERELAERIARLEQELTEARAELEQQFTEARAAIEKLNDETICAVCKHPIGTRYDVYRCYDCGMPHHKGCAQLHIKESDPRQYACARKMEQQLTEARAEN